MYIWSYFAGVVVKRVTAETSHIPERKNNSLSQNSSETNEIVVKKDLKKKRRERLLVVGGKKSEEPSPEEQITSQSVLDPLTAVHSFAELTDFLEAETLLRKRDRKSAWSRQLDQSAWKGLSKKVRNSFNLKTPNKSLKLARKMLREGILNNGQ